MDHINSSVTPPYAWINGSPIAFEHGLSLNNRALWYGDGVFETISIRDGRALKLGLHIDRLSVSADSGDLKLPVSSDQLTQEVIRAASMTHGTQGKFILRIMLYRGGNLGLLEEGPTERMMILQEAPPIPDSLYREGVKVKLRPFTFQDKNPRKSLDWSHAILELRKARQQNFDDVLMFNQEEGILESSAANVFFLGRQGDLLEVATPPLSTGILPGTTRQVLIELLERSKIPVTERPIFPDELPRFDEAFLTSTLKGLVPIQKINSQTLFTLRPNSTFREFQRLFQTWEKVQIG